MHALGIPHPPGTPLFVFGARAWATLFGWLPFATAVNAASALCTAGALAAFAWLMTRWTGRPAAGIASALVGGTMTAVWQSATETEVYAYAMLAAALAMVAGELAGSRWSERHRTLVAAVFGLAVPLHISVLVAGPAVILLAATDRGGGVSWRAALAPAGAWCLAAALGTVSTLPALAAAPCFLAAALLPAGGTRASTRRAAILAPVVTLLGASFVLVMLVRAAHDPAVNQGRPDHWQGMVDVVARRQYDVPPLWPRRAPLWLQIGNVIEYADWQVASSLSDAPGPSPWRTPVTVIFASLGIAGALWHRRRDPRSATVLGLLLASATVGVVAILNLRAGPSYGWGVLPQDALREARERDYFFALGFLVSGLWCGCGIVAVTDRVRHPAARALWLVAAVPLLLNWRAVDRRRAPDATVAMDVARALLDSLPRNAVLVVAGDNDTFPLWFAREVDARRRDVTPVTIPLLGARWYREELNRRHALLSADDARHWRGLSATLLTLGASTTVTGRPLVVAVSVAPSERRALSPGRGWTLEGMWYALSPPQLPATGERLMIDSAAVAGAARAAQSLASALPMGDDRRLARDPAARYVQHLLNCPALALARVQRSRASRDGLLESICNFR